MGKGKSSLNDFFSSLDDAESIAAREAMDFGDDDEYDEIERMRKQQKAASDENDDEEDDSKKSSKSKKSAEENDDDDDSKSKGSKGAKKNKDIDFEDEEEEDDSKKAAKGAGDEEEGDIILSATSTLFEALAEKAGWELDEEDKRPSTPEELIDYLLEAVEQSSTPTYHSEEIKMLDEFVKNGGSLNSYLELSSKTSNYDDLDLEVESNQKSIIRELLTEKGFNKEQINKKISKYESAGLLEDEAVDALELLKEIREEQKAELIKSQNEAAEKAERAQKQFYDSIVDELKTIKDFHGIPLSKVDKKEALDYLFKVGPSGKTKFQEETMKSAKSLVETAIYRLKGSKLIESARKSGQSSAVDKFKQSLSRQGKPGSTQSHQREGDRAHVWDFMS